MAKDKGEEGGGESEVIFVSREKLDRAKEIVALVSGAQAPRTAEEVERQAHYAMILSGRDINPKAKDALRAVYELLGGLVRTPEEQRAAEEQGKKMAAKFKKKAVQADK